MKKHVIPAERLREDMTIAELAEVVGLSAETIRRAFRDADGLRDSPCYRRAWRGGRGMYLVDGREFVRDVQVLNLWVFEVAE